MPVRARRVRALCAGSGLLLIASFAAGPAEAAADGAPGSISLVPAVVTLEGTGGQAHTQTLSLTNHTTRTLTFEMMALDVIARDGVRSACGRWCP